MHKLLIERMRKDGGLTVIREKDEINIGENNMKKINDALKAEILEIIAGGYLCSPIPQDWDYLDKGERIVFILDNAWEPIEHEDPEMILELINTMADSIVSAIEDNDE